MAVTDIRVQLAVLDHPKIRKLQRRLGDAGLICLLRLWLWVATVRPLGKLTNFDSEDVEIGAGWQGERGEFIRTLKELRLIDQDNDKCLALHNWAKWQSWLVGAPARSERARNLIAQRWAKENSAADSPPNQNGAPVPVDAQPVNKKTRNPKPRKPEGYSPEFERAWNLYPTRPGNSKKEAYANWCARLAEGVQPADLTVGVENYAAYVRAEQTEPGFIKHAATFFGPKGEHWKSDWAAGGAAKDGTPGGEAEARNREVIGDLLTKTAVKTTPPYTN